MLYQIKDGTLHAGGQAVLEHFDFEIKGQEKIAVVGANGAGKTTFLRLLAGELSLSRDDKREGSGIYQARNITIGYLKQTFTEEQLGLTVDELMLKGCPYKDTWEKERFDYEMEYDRIFTGFGFAKEDKKKLLSEFSGGQLTRLGLVELLLKKPDLLLLDEPTNHLDMEAVEWLEQYIAAYPGAVVEVSHDRFFLDKTATKILEIEHRRCKTYVGNYTQYRKEKKKQLELLWKRYELQQEEIKRLNENIERFRNKPKKAAFARSRKKLLERMELIEKPEERRESLAVAPIEPELLGNKLVADIEELSIGYEAILQTISLRIRRGSKIGIIGPNGIGKSTFLKTVVGLLPAHKGKCQLGDLIQTGYFEQRSVALKEEQTVLEAMQERFPGLMEKQLRQYLAGFLFQGAECNKVIGSLSGGEQSRVMLARLLLERPNFLVLDEPTNHMDIPAKEALEQMLQAYTGTMLFVSHDRYFLSQVADSLLVFTEKGVSYYPFGYEHYCARMAAGAARGDKGETVFGMLSDKDQVLLDGLKTVPKGSSLLGRRVSEELIFLEWKLSLAKERLEKKGGIYEKLLEESLRLEWLKQEEGGSESALEKSSLEDISEHLEGSLESYTDACVEWLEIWQEYEEYHQKFIEVTC